MDHDRWTGPPLLAALLVLVGGLVPDRFCGDGPTRLRASLSSGLFNRSDASRIERGYYEQVLADGRRLDDLVDLPAFRGRRHSGSAFAAPVDSAPLVVRTGDLREVALAPSAEARRWGVEWRTNEWGMRDRSYAAEKPPGTFRIALVGDSIAAGWGVAEPDRFESVLEREWDERSRRSGGPAIEIINCAVPGHSPGQRWRHFELVGWPTRPDLVLCEATEADQGWDARRLRYVLARGQGFDAAVYREVLSAAGARPGWEPARYQRLLRPLRREILAGVYRAMADECRSRGVPIVVALVPRVGHESDAEGRRTLLALARCAGLTRTVDASDAYDGASAEALAVAPKDFHPNARGHARLARRLDGLLSDLPELRPFIGGGRSAPRPLAARPTAGAVVSNAQTPQGAATP